MTDRDLLYQFQASTEKGVSSQAFSDLVRRHLNMVYAAARRQVRDAHLAEDVAQAVFIVLARKAGSISYVGSSIVGWLLKTTYFTAQGAMRMEQRRKRHEAKAAAMAFKTTDVPVASRSIGDVSDVLDGALMKMRAADRDVIAMRYLQDRSFEEIGLALGISPDAAQKSTSRAIARLRELLADRYPQSSPKDLAASLAGCASVLAPAHLLEFMQQQGSALGSAATGSTTASAISKTVLGPVIAMKYAAGFLAILLICGGTLGGIVWLYNTNNTAGTSNAAAPSRPLTYKLPPPPSSQATLLAPEQGWQSTDFAKKLNTDLAAMEIKDGHPVFTVTEPSMRHVWWRPLESPIDPSEFPVLVVTYRARHIDTKDRNNYVIWLEDGFYSETRPAHVLKPMVGSQVIADGNVHEFRANLRKTQPPAKGPITQIALGVREDDKGPAEFELLDLRFEAIPQK